MKSYSIISQADGNSKQFQTSEIIFLLKEAIRKLPKSLALTPVAQKKPLRKGWQTEAPLSIAALESLLDSKKWDGVGLRTGDVSKGLLAIDFDGLSTQPLKDAIESVYGLLPLTVGWTSGKNGRYQVLYQIPDHYRERFKSFTNAQRHELEIGGRIICCNKDEAGKKWEQIEFRYNNSQSVLPPSAHPETGGYRYLDGQSFDDVAIAVLPDPICQFILSLQSPPRQQSKPFKKMADIKIGGTMTDDERDRRLALEILQALPQTEPGSGTYHDYREFACALKNRFGEIDAITTMEGHSPQRNWRQIIQSSNGNFDMGTVVKVARDFIPAWNYPQWWIDSMPKDYDRGQGQPRKVIPITKNQPKPDLKVDITATIEQGILGATLDIELSKIAKAHGLPVREIKNIHKQLSDDAEIADDRSEKRQEIEQLLIAKNSAINIATIVPESIAAPIEALSDRLNLRPELGLTALLCGVSGCLKLGTKIEVDMGWKEPPTLYGAVVAPSSQKKTPIISAMVSDPLNSLQERDFEQFQEKLKQYKSDLVNYKNTPKEERDDQFPDGPPVEPTLPLRYTENFTTESICPLFNEQSNGLVIHADELAGMFKGLNQYKGGKGSDAETILSLYNGKGTVILRRKERLYIKESLVSIIGGIQPKVLADLFKASKEDSNGNWARFMFVQQPATATLLNPDSRGVDVSPVMDALYRQAANFEKTTYRLNYQGRKILFEAHNRHELAKVAKGDHPLSNVHGKSGGRIARLALTLHIVKYASMSVIPPETIDPETVTAAVTLTDFYLSQAQSIYSELMGSDSKDGHNLPASLAKIVEFAKKSASQQITARDVANRRYSPSSKTAVGWFKELEEMGYGVYSKSGRSHKFTLKDSIDAKSASLTPTDAAIDAVLTQPNGIYSKGYKSIDAIDAKIFDQTVSPIDASLKTNDPPPQPEGLVNDAPPNGDFSLENCVDCVDKSKTLDIQGETLRQYCVNTCVDSSIDAAICVDSQKLDPWEGEDSPLEKPNIQSEILRQSCVNSCVDNFIDAAVCVDSQKSDPWEGKDLSQILSIGDRVKAWSESDGGHIEAEVLGLDKEEKNIRLKYCSGYIATVSKNRWVEIIPLSNPTEVA